MKKKLFAALAAMIPLLSLSGFAAQIELNLLEGGVSVLDAIFLIGVGIVLIGVILVCIALFASGKKPKDMPQESEEELSAEVPQADEPAEEAETPQEESAAEEPKAETTEESDAEADAEPKEEAEEKPAYSLTLTGVGNEEFMIIPLADSVTVGRRTTSDLVLQDNTVSGTHCRIFIEENQVYIEDLNSTNGTYLNETEVTEKTLLPKGAEIRLGQQKYKINY